MKNKVFQREEEANSESIESYANEEESLEGVEHVRRPTPDDIEISKDCMLKAWVGSP